MGLLDRLRRRGGVCLEGDVPLGASRRRDRPRRRRLPLVRIWSRGHHAEPRPPRHRRHARADALVDPDDLVGVVDGLHDRQEPREARDLRLHRREARHALALLPEFGERARRHALGRRGPRRQALDRHEHSRHVSGAPAERPPRGRLRGAQPRARRASAGPAAATQDGGLQDRRRLRERRRASRRVLRRHARRARSAPPRVPGSPAERGLGPLHRRRHRVRPAASLLLEGTRPGSPLTEVPLRPPPPGRPGDSSPRCRPASRSSSSPITGTR